MTPDRDFAIGTVSFELDIALTSSSGRDKHTDVDEQAAFLVDSLARFIEENFQFDDATVLRLRYTTLASTISSAGFTWLPALAGAGALNSPSAT